MQVSLKVLTGSEISPDDVISTSYKEPGRRYCERLKTEICSETWLLGRGATPGEKKTNI